MELQTSLKDLGLNPKEAQTYLGLLQLGQATVVQISRRIGLKRPTVYLVLDELIRRGYVATVPHEKKRVYIALPPERLKEAFERKREILRVLLPQLSALYNTKTARPAVQLFEGIDSINHVYEEIVNSGEKEILSFFSPETVSVKSSESFKLFIKLLRENPQIKSRELVYTKDKQHYYLKAVRRLPNRMGRFVSERTRFFTDNIIWLDKIAIFYYEKELVVVIQSKDVVETFRSLFELAWQGVSRE